MAGYASTQLHLRTASARQQVPHNQSTCIDRDEFLADSEEQQTDVYLERRKDNGTSVGPWTEQHLLPARSVPSEQAASADPRGVFGFSDRLGARWNKENTWRCSPWIVSPVLRLLRLSKVVPRIHPALWGLQDVVACLAVTLTPCDEGNCPVGDACWIPVCDNFHPMAHQYFRYVTKLKSGRPGIYPSTFSSFGQIARFWVRYSQDRSYTCNTTTPFVFLRNALVPCHEHSLKTDLGIG